MAWDTLEEAIEDWVAVAELHLSYYFGKTILVYIYIYVYILTMVTSFKLLYWGDHVNFYIYIYIPTMVT